MLQCVANSNSCWLCDPQAENEVDRAEWVAAIQVSASSDQSDAGSAGIFLRRTNRLIGPLPEDGSSPGSLLRRTRHRFRGAFMRTGGAFMRTG
eukprot:189213-Prorocentrum_minimum.AAC.1